MTQSQTRIYEIWKMRVYTDTLRSIVKMSREALDESLFSPLPQILKEATLTHLQPHYLYKRTQPTRHHPVYQSPVFDVYSDYLIAQDAWMTTLKKLHLHMGIVTAVKCFDYLKVVGSSNKGIPARLKVTVGEESIIVVVILHPNRTLNLLHYKNITPQHTPPFSSILNEFFNHFPELGKTLLKTGKLTFAS